MLTVPVAGKAADQTEVRFASGNGVEHAAGQNGAQTLGDDIGNEIPAGEPAAEPEAHGDGRVEMAAGNVAEGIRSGQDSQTESQSDAHESHARIGEGAGIDSCTAAAKNKPERAKKFSQILLHKQPAQDPAACRGECRLLFPWLLEYAGLRHLPGRRLTQTHAAESREKPEPLRDPAAVICSLRPLPFFFNAGKILHFQLSFPAHLIMCATFPPLAQFSLLLYIYKELTIVLF